MFLSSLFHRSHSQRMESRRPATDDVLATPPRPAEHRRAVGRACLEALEDRRLMSFTSAVSYPAGTNPQAVVTADFNNDGRFDLAAANAGDNTVSVLLGDGQGGFGAAQPSATGTFPGSLAVADFNNDGKPDLVTGNQGSWNVSLLLGNGDGTFAAPLSKFSRYMPLSVAAGDFNADGNADLLINEDDWNSFGYIEVRLGDGQGGFATANGYHITYPVPEVTVADLNGDGKLDVLTAHGLVMPGNGDGTLNDSENWGFGASHTSQALAVGDFTRDGIQDVVVAGETVDVFPGLGGFMFAAPIQHAANGHEHTSVAAADLDGDGRLDAITSDADTGTVSVLLGNGDGTLRYVGAFAAGSSPTAVAVGDFDGDGLPDAAAANSGSNTVSVLLNDGAWSGSSNLPSLRIGDVTVTEGNAGTTDAVFTVTLSAASTETITVVYATADGTATAGSDYNSTNGTLTFAPGQTSKTVTVPLNGDRLGEPHETFNVNLSRASNATIADGQGNGTILDDEPRISINNVSKSEGKNRKTTLFTFTVTLSTAYDQAVSMSYRTADGTATTSDGDYTAKTGTLTFSPGETTKTITIEVKGDGKREANESFALELFGASSNALLLDAVGLGTILNDD